MTFKEFVTSLINFFDTSVIPLLFAIMFFIFLWGIFQYFFIKREDPAARSEGAQFMLWGIIGFAVVISMWGLVRLLLGSFGIGV
tara:strand:- start:16282 stop:16533 length:252 start_codon:yes stop_codon:yes gene_type:complete